MEEQFIGPVQEAMLTIYGVKTPGRGAELLISQRMPRKDALNILLEKWHSREIITEIRVVLL